MPEPVDIDSCDVKLVGPDRVRAVQASLPTSDVVQELADVFGLMGDPNRLRLLAILLEAGELCVCDLAAAAGMAESTTSHALRLLRAHQVVKVRRAGRTMHYSLRDGHVRMLLDVALEHVGHSEGRGPAVAR